MNEQFANADLKTEPAVESEKDMTELLTELLMHAAEMRPDELLGDKEWKEFHMDRYFTAENYSFPEGFSWMVYVLPSKTQENEKYVGIKVFGQHGEVLDQYEIAVQNKRLPFSDPARRVPIEAEMKRRREVAEVVKEQQMQEREAQVEKIRGFPSGTYELRATYPHHSGNMRTTSVTDFFPVTIDDSREKIERNALGQTVGLGLHNFGMTTYENHHDAPVVLELCRDGKIAATFKARFDGSGYVVEEKK